MTGLWILLAGLAVVAAIGWAHTTRRARRRSALRSQRLSDEESRQVAENFPLWSRLPNEIREQTEGWMKVLLDEKVFEACGELDSVTHEMKLTIAAQACLLIAHRPKDYYERLKSILVYPGAYQARDTHGDTDMRLGESWGTGSVVLGWSSVVQGGRNPRDGHNVVLHEFAHQLDQENGAADGVPELRENGDYGRWSRAFAPAYELFCERVNEGKKSVLDDYGATNPAEFFAVATETFFEKPEAMKREEAEIYDVLASFYRMDPMEWQRVAAIGT